MIMLKQFICAIVYGHQYINTKFYSNRTMTSDCSSCGKKDIDR